MAIRRNPYVGKEQPELFGGKSRVFVPLADVPEKELLKLPKEAFSESEWAELPGKIKINALLISGDGALPKRLYFTDEQWEELDEEVQEEIYEGDEESQARIKELVSEIVSRWEWEARPDDLFRLVEEYFEEWLRENADDLWDKLNNREYSSLEEVWKEQGYTEEQIKTAINTALQDTNIYQYTEGSSYGGAFYKGNFAEGQIYIDRDAILKLVDLMPYDEIAIAAKKIEKETYLDEDKIIKEISDSYDRKTDFELIFDRDLYVDVDPDSDKLERAVRAEIEDMEPDVDLAPQGDEEARILYKFKDGFYVLDLTPAELPAEGKNMGMCVGRPDMGYISALKQGKIRMFSMRRPSGKPLFTIEANRDKASGEIIGIEQIKGKANRLPGFDLGKTSAYSEVKKDEVEKVIEFLTSIKATEGVFVQNIEDLHPACKAISMDTTAWGDKLREMLAKHDGKFHYYQLTGGAQQNPARACKAGGSGEGHGACTGFCVPYRDR